MSFADDGVTHPHLSFRGIALLLLLSVVTATSSIAQPVTNENGPGLPIHNETVQQACGSCHASDDAGLMSRISFRRTTPEGWQQTIRRMVTLNNIDLAPETAREVVKYLSNTLGLAPEEAQAAAYEAERRADDQPYKDPDIQQTCTQCHSLGRVLSQRRTDDEWSLLMAMHRGYYFFVDFQSFTRTGAPSDEPEPVDQAISHFSTELPFETPEWAAWSATQRPARVGGAWLLRGHAPGLGPVYGRVDIAPVPDTEDEFTTATTYVYARDGRAVTRTGRAIIYTGFQWRGRSLDTNDTNDGLREVMFIERGWQRMTGRWFTGGYDEDGLDVTLERITTEPVVAGVHPPSLRVGTNETIRIFGQNLANTGTLDLGPGITVVAVLGASQNRVDARIRIAPEAAVGVRDLFLDPASRSDALTVYDRVHRLTVTPQAGMARIGGIRFPKQYQQFEAHGYHNGPDGEPSTGDDLDLGLMDVDWSLEEYAVTVGDDDLRYVGALDQQGRFTPAVDGPNAERSGNRNNVGDVWVVAAYQQEATNGNGGNTLRARAHLLVTVPLYMRWDPTAVEQP